jgi:hypothetical protein
MTGRHGTGPAPARVHGCPGHAGEPVWLLTSTAGQWIAECGTPGCNWTSSEQLVDLVDDLAAGHALTHQTSAGAA